MRWEIGFEIGRVLVRLCNALTRRVAIFGQNDHVLTPESTYLCSFAQSKPEVFRLVLNIQAFIYFGPYQC